MRKTSLTQQPKIVNPLTRTADFETKNLIKQIQEEHGRACQIQDEKGGYAATRWNGDVLEKQKNGKWVSVFNASSATPTSTPRVRSYGSSVAVPTTSTGDKVKVSSTDGMAQYLESKVVAGTGVDVTKSTTANVEKLTLSLDSGETITLIMTALNAATSKDTPIDADMIPLMDSANGNVMKKLSWANIKATLKTYLDGLYSALGHTHAYIPTTEKAAAGGVASLDGSSLVVQNPANATATPTASKIPIADGFGKLDGWITASASTASDVTTSTGNFNKRLSSADDTVQKALDTLDDYQSFKLSNFNPFWLLEEPWDELINGTLSTGNATPASVTRTFGNATTDNNGMGGISWTGTTFAGSGWTAAAGYCHTRTAAKYLEVVIRTAGTNNIVLDRGTGISDPDSYDNHVAVTLDSVVQAVWDQDNNQTYTLSSVAAGVHTIRITAVDAINLAAPDSDIYMAIASIQYSAFPYQGVGAASDVVEILYIPPWMTCCTISVGSVTDGVGTYNSSLIGEGIIQRLPLGDGYTDNNFDKDAQTPAGWTMHTSACTGILRLPITGDTVTSGRSIIKPGMSMTLSATPGTRGRRVTASNACVSVAPSMSASVDSLRILPCLGKVTSAGTYSGQVVLLVITQFVSAANNAVTILTSSNVGIAADFFALPTLT
jgi:hypothetical protein